MSLLNTAPKPVPYEVQSGIPHPGATRKASVTAVLIAAGIVAAMIITYAVGLDKTAAVPVDSAGGTVQSVESADVGQSDGALSESLRVPSYGQFAGLDAREFLNALLVNYANIRQGGSAAPGSGRIAYLGSMPELDARLFPNVVVTTVRPNSSAPGNGLGDSAALGRSSDTDFGQFAGLNTREYSNAAVGNQLTTTAGPLINTDTGDGEGALLGNDASTSLGMFPELDASEVPNTLADNDGDVKSGLAPDGGTGEGVKDRRTSIAAPGEQDATGNPRAQLLSAIDISIWPYPEVHGEAAESDSHTHIGPSIEHSE